MTTLGLHYVKGRGCCLPGRLAGNIAILRAFIGGKPLERPYQPASYRRSTVERALRRTGNPEKNNRTLVRKWAKMPLSLSDPPTTESTIWSTNA